MFTRPDCRKCGNAPGSAFSCLTSSQRSRLSRIVIPHAYARDQMILHQGNPSLAIYCVHSGLIKLTRHIRHGESALVGLRSTGDIFGYRAVLAGLPYGISAETIEPSVVCTIARDDFLALVEEGEGMAIHLLKRLAREFLFAEEQLVERNSERVVQRTARFLARLAESAGPPAEGEEHVRLPTRHKDLALLIGTTPETLSRTLHSLAARGFVEVGRHEISVRDVAGLRRVAG